MPQGSKLPKGGSFSIVRRLTAWTVAVSIFALLVNGLLIFLAVRPLFDDLTESLAGRVAAVRSALQESTPAQRGQQAQSLSSLGLRVRRASSVAADSPSEAGRAPLSDSFLERLHSLLGAGVDVSLVRRNESGANAQLLAKFSIDGEPWTIEFPEPHGSPREPLWSLLVALLFVAIVPLVAMLAGIRLITRPMAHLAREVADRSERLRPLDMSHAVGTELREVFLSFNGLVKAVTGANEARRNMLAGVSHDLRTPLARLRLRAEIECSKETALALENDCDALDRIIGQFLAYAQGEAGVSLGVPEPLAELVRHIGSFYAERGVSIEMQDEAASEVSYPDLAIWRIVTNLVDNALSHGKLPISIVVEVDAFDCRISVNDAGTGIPASDAENAFKPFVKLRSETPGVDGDFGHCGLGLAIIAQICAELGGKVFHRPYDGTLSAVGVLLPRHYAGEAPSSLGLSDGSVGLTPSQTFKSAL
jgi:two-component system, OmpR family, osmolarity sensor histidine kinase EnvZ